MQIGTLALVPRLAEAVKIPVIAAGGIAVGRSIAAALALGAAGVQMGTAFLWTDEAAVAGPRRAAMREADAGDTRMTKSFTGRPARAIVNRHIRMMAPHEDALPAFPLLDGLTLPLDVASANAGSADFMALLAGQSVGVNRSGGAADLVRTLVAETDAALGRRILGQGNRWRPSASDCQNVCERPDEAPRCQRKSSSPPALGPLG